MNRKKLVVVVLAVAAILALILAIWAISRKPLSFARDAVGRIVYQSDQNGSKEIYMLDLASMQIVRLTDNSFNDYSPAYIPALERLGFVSDRESGTNLFTINLDGSNETAVFSQPMLLDYPDWSPDGTSLVTSYTEGCTDNTLCNFDLYRFDLPTGIITQLTNSTGSEWVPQWSPDGTRIAFASDRDGDSEIYVMNADGSNIVQLTDNNGYDGRPRWSPDGEKISFESDQDGGDWDVFIMNADGSKPRVLTNNDDADEWMQFWSPDGEWLVFVSAVDGDYELYIIKANGRNLQQLTSNDFSDEAPIWIP